MIAQPTTIKNPLVITQGYHDGHGAIDFSNFVNDVFAVGDSNIITTGKTSSGANYIFTYCRELNIYISYVHVTSILKSKTLVSKGHTIGITDQSGKASASHLHLACFENIEATKRINFHYFLNKYFIEWRYSTNEKTIRSISEDRYVIR